MIRAAEGPLRVSLEDLHSLQVSLNSPVVSVDALPVGPAAAAIALHGSEGATLMVRSLRTGTVAFFHVAAVRADASLAREAAHSHAESLGFLFDDEIPVDAGTPSSASWPGWVEEIFVARAPRLPAPEAASLLSKYRWSLPIDGARIASAP